MSRCHVIESGMPGIPSVCTVHDHPVPCPSNGWPAILDPVHVFSEPSQVEAVEGARQHVNGSRPILVHQGPELDAERHSLARGGPPCWCDPVEIPAG